MRRHDGMVFNILGEDLFFFNSRAPLYVGMIRLYRKLFRGFDRHKTFIFRFL